jgi:hypothetical protein
MSEARNKMNQALKAVVVPLLRERGFTGSFPHFRRRRKEHVDLFSFQFSQYGGCFIIEIGQCEPSGYTTPLGEHIPPTKVKAWDLHPDQRARLKPGSGARDWFRFDGSGVDVFSRAAESVVPFLDEAERMFDDFDKIYKLG